MITFAPAKWIAPEHHSAICCYTTFTWLGFVTEGWCSLSASDFWLPKHPQTQLFQSQPGDTQHHSLWKGAGSLKTILSHHNSRARWAEGGWGGEGGGTEEELLWHIPEVERALPHLRRYFSRDHVRLSPVYFQCDYIDKDTNIFELWTVVLPRQSLLYLCIWCGTVVDYVTCVD